METVLHFYQHCPECQPQMEFLLNGLTNSDPCAMHIAVNGCEIYRTLAEQLFFQNDTPSVRKLKKLLEKAG